MNSSLPPSMWTAFPLNEYGGNKAKSIVLLRVCADANRFLKDTLSIEGSDNRCFWIYQILPFRPHRLKEARKHFYSLGWP